MSVAERICKQLALASMTVGLALAAGCHVDTHKNGNDDDVKIATPFGGMSVKTNESVVEGGVGLSVYPGATLDKARKGHDNGAADVNMSFGSFHLGVKALSYVTADKPEQVLAFYRKDMGTVRHRDPVQEQPRNRQAGPYPGRALLRAQR